MQNKFAEEQKAEMWEGSDFWAASFVKKAVSTAERGEALDRRKAGCGMLL